VLGLGAWIAYARPALSVVPPDLIADTALKGTPPLDSTSLTPERARLAERGRYLYITTTCGMCHENDGSGGKKIDWKVFGTLYASNITSDPETGVGKWTDAELARAIRSGMSQNGRMLHWQAMTWDYASNLDEEDVRALVAYLRTLPPVKHEVPRFRLPATDDCDIYTFWTSSEASPPGCANP
jgi:cytochrome c553